MIKDLTKVTKKDIEESAKKAVESSIIALQDDAEVYADALCAFFRILFKLFLFFLQLLMKFKLPNSF